MRTSGHPSSQGRTGLRPVSIHVSLRRTVLSNAASPTAKVPKKVSGSKGDVYDAVIVGAGISGLVTGLALQTKHSDNVSSFLITEARERVGGNITTVSDGDYVWEEGPNSCTPSDSVLEAAVRGRRAMRIDFL
jgi:protoporphyrinogen/coproporphyrinogen III oxidase